MLSRFWFRKDNVLLAELYEGFKWHNLIGSRNSNHLRLSVSIKIILIIRWIKLLVFYWLQALGYSNSIGYVGRCLWLPFHTTDKAITWVAASNQTFFPRPIPRRLFQMVRFESESPSSSITAYLLGCFNCHTKN